MEKINILNQIRKILNDLFPLNRSLAGPGVRETLNYITDNYLPNSQIKSIASGSKVFDWEVPPEWKVEEAYIKNVHGERIIDYKVNNVCLVSHSESVDKIVSEEELFSHLHTLPDYPDWIPYRTSYYKRDWGFCCAHNLLTSEKFLGPFEVKIDSELITNGNLNWLECIKEGDSEKEILISSYCCHPSLANDNLSGVVASVLLFKYLQSLETKYTYRLVIAPETIGAISFLSQADTTKILGGMILTCVAGPGEYSIKEGFDRIHWINQAAHNALRIVTNNHYKTYPFSPDGSDERQYSTPGFRIVTPSIHKSKYYEYPEYHTSADNLDFISASSLMKTINIYKEWINLIESFCYPVRTQMHGEYQLGRQGLYPLLGGTLSQPSHNANQFGSLNQQFDLDSKIEINGEHLDAFNWLMHLADGTLSNFEIAQKSNLNIQIINQSISALHQKRLIILK